MDRLTDSQVYRVGVEPGPRAWVRRDGGGCSYTGPNMVFNMYIFCIFLLFDGGAAVHTQA